VASSKDRARKLAREKLDRQLARRAGKQRRRRQIQAGIGAAVALLLIVGGVAWLGGAFDDELGRIGAPALGAVVAQAEREAVAGDVEAAAFRDRETRRAAVEDERIAGPGVRPEAPPERAGFPGESRFERRVRTCRSAGRTRFAAGGEAVVNER